MDNLKLVLLILAIITAPFILISYYHLINDFIYTIFNVKEGYGEVVGYFSFLLTLAVPGGIAGLIAYRKQFK